jgi:thioredoxin reductase (NADPH)
LTAALYAARASLCPLVIEGMEPGGQLTTTTGVENFPGFPESVSGPVLMGHMKQQAERFGARFLAGRVASADFRRKPLTLALDGGRRLETLAVIIATGATARYLGIESEQRLRGRGVSACATCDGPLYLNVPVAVVGGGDTAMEEALFLTRFASMVTLIHRRSQFRASKIMAERAAAHPKVRILWNTVVEEVLDVAKNEVTGLRLLNRETGAKGEIAVSALFVAIGHRPNTEPFAGQIELDANGYIAASRARTSAEGVFAAGDVHDPTYRQAVTAAGFGCMAALEAVRYLEAMGL